MTWKKKDGTLTIWQHMDGLKEFYFMSKKAKKIYVVGHKNPDTDSVCSAIAYAELKRRVTGDEYVARRAGQINEETHYVLKKFGVDVPGSCKMLSFR